MVKGAFVGHADSALNPRGIAQAEALGKRMKNEPLDYIYSSDLERAQHTARLVGASSDWEVQLMEGLRERDLGVLKV